MSTSHKLLSMGCIAWLAGCGMDDLGVLAIEFDLHPMMEAGNSEDLAALESVLAAVPFATGLVHADPVGGSGMTMVDDLPVLPDEYEYSVTLEFATGPRHDLPSVAAPSGGHHHRSTARGVQTAEGVVEISPLEYDGDGSWFNFFYSKHAPDGDLGALREAVVTISPRVLGLRHVVDPGEGEVTVMYGVLEADQQMADAPMGGGGHEH